MCTLPIFSVVKSSLFIRAVLLDRILATEKTTRTPRVHLVYREIVTYGYHNFMNMQGVDKGDILPDYTQ